MKVEILSFCDYATHAGGKLTLVGVFDRLNTTRLPATVPVMGLAIKMRLEDKDIRDTPHKFLCKLAAPSGADVLEVGGEMVTKRPANAQNEPVEMGLAEFAFPLPGVTFKESGRHVATLSVDGEVVGQTPLFVVHTPRVSAIPRGAQSK